MKDDRKSFQQTYLKKGTFIGMMIMNFLIVTNIIMYYTLNVKFHQFLLLIFALILLLNKILKQNQLFQAMNQFLFKKIAQYKQNQPIIIGTKRQVFFDQQMIEQYTYIKINQYIQDLKFFFNKINDLMTQFLIKLTIVLFLIENQNMVAANWIFLNFMFLMFSLNSVGVQSLKNFFKVQKHYQFFTISVINSNQIQKLEATQKDKKQTSAKIQQPEIMKEKISQKIQQKPMQQVGILKRSIKKKLFIQIPSQMSAHIQNQGQGKGLFIRK